MHYASDFIVVEFVRHGFDRSVFGCVESALVAGYVFYGDKFTDKCR